ncbi:hypothetical protein [Fictibacillus norfolkensis]|jgi:hypothetical protein|uniref:Uncharacterized protein n=1 Tax=Fictibacillus norfolkensis TaxID=2762233 RepID=A0ABR8SS21_9BACL|nr:hypothetical protein [Fictibacillus norfolkensis]MBD7965879.1 hypothetical protein [Fictibacillus norfolkensis]
MNRLQHLLFGFLVGIVFLALGIVDAGRYGAFGDLFYFINAILFYVGYGVVVFLGVWILFIVMGQLGDESQKERE